jgi:trans-aconitate methyltransferase
MAGSRSRWRSQRRCSRTWSSIILAESGEVLPEVTFHDTNECFERSYDMVIASNSLRYEEDWQQLLRQLVHASANSAFLTHVPMVRQQHSFASCCSAPTDMAEPFPHSGSLFRADRS